MAQIFVSHSQKDKDLRHFFLDAFAGTKVKPLFEELENQPPSGVTADKIHADIRASNAVFVLLSENVEALKHTRDWVNWECGTAVNKPIWVFEPLTSRGKISVVVPRFTHYALFDTGEEWRKYLRSLIESYDDSHVIPTLSATTGVGAMLGEKDKGVAAIAGFAVGLGLLALHEANKPMSGVAVRCWKCSSNYRIHRYGEFRCAACNAKSILNQPQLVENPDRKALGLT